MEFETQIRNIACGIAYTGQSYDSARCDIAEASWTPPPRPSSCQYGWGSALQVTAVEAAGFACIGDTVADEQVVPYGTLETLGPFRCDVESTGATCTAGHGFTVSKAAYRLF